jgi:hypothetical protein
MIRSRKIADKAADNAWLFRGREVRKSIRARDSHRDASTSLETSSAHLQNPRAGFGMPSTAAFSVSNHRLP